MHKVTMRKNLIMATILVYSLCNICQMYKFVSKIVGRLARNRYIDVHFFLGRKRSNCLRLDTNINLTWVDLAKAW